MSAATELDPRLVRLQNDPELWARKYGRIRDKRKQIVPLQYTAGQKLLHQKLMAQKAAGLPERAVALKARQVGVSTYAQARLVHSGTLTPNYDGLCLAHDRETGGKLWRMGDRLYRNLPAGEELLKPPIRHRSRAKLFEWAVVLDDGTLYPDSTYLVDTAGESEAGRGGTYSGVHASEFAFWPKQLDKLTAIQSGVPKEPGTFILIESTANGEGLFKDLCDDAMAGRSDYAFFFWPWWKEEGYSLAFAGEGDREEFARELGSGPYGEDEPGLIEPGPLDTETGLSQPLTLEQLHWRRWAIPNLCGGKLDKFRQEYPATPEEAFLASGRKVFEPTLIVALRREVEHYDPRIVSPDNPGPWLGKLAAGASTKSVGRNGPVDVPAEPTLRNKSELAMLEPAPWKLWLPRDTKGMPVIPDDRGYVLAVDVSEGLSESDPEDGEPAYHAIEVIDHKSGVQVAEYVSRVDPALLAAEVMLAALLFNDAWAAVEKTGPGLRVVRDLYHDFRYPFTYFRKAHDRRSDEKQSDRLGWDTTRETKPLLIANGEELLREGTTGIRSRELVAELGTYVRTKTGKMIPERNRFADRLMAWLIARQVALEKPYKPPRKKGDDGGFTTFKPMNPTTGY